MVQSAFYAFTLCWTWLLLRLKCDVAFRSAMALTWPADAWRWAVAGPVVALGLGMAAVALRAPRAALPIESFLDSRAAVVVTGLLQMLGGEATVLAAAVVAKPDDKWGETPVAFVVRKAGDLTPAEALRSWVNAQLGKTQRLTELRFISELPRSAIGNVLKRELRDAWVSMNKGRVQ